MATDSWSPGQYQRFASERLLPAEVYEDFLAAYRATLLPRLDDRRPYLLPFPRLLMWARLDQ